MSGRSRMPPHGNKGQPLPQLHDPPPPSHFGGRGPIHPPPGLLEDRPPPPPFGLLGGRAPHHPAILEERLAAQLEDIQAFLVDNQRLAATHVALKQEVAAAQYEIHRLSHAAASMQSEKDLQLREAYEKAMKLESELQSVETIKAELIQVRGETQKLNAVRQELTGQVQALTQDWNQTNADMQKAPAIKAEIETMKQEVQRVRAAIEFEKKGYADNYEQGQLMEKNLISMAREVEKLRAEVANTERRARASVSAGNQGYAGNHGNPDPNYSLNPYPAGYGMNPAPGYADSGSAPGSQYGSAPSSQYGSAPAHGSWGAYNTQQAQGRR